MILDTQRLRLRPMTGEDAAFILELVTDPSWLRYIGDKGVRDVEGARRYIEGGPIEMYRRFGFGLLVVELRAPEAGSAHLPPRGRGPSPSVGICGLIKRDTLPDVDIGFAFLPRYRAQGLAIEAARAVLAHGRETLALARIVAIVSPDNVASTRLLEKLGLRFERMVDKTDADPVALYATG